MTRRNRTTSRPIVNGSHRVFDENESQSNLISDLCTACGRIILVSPFATVRGVQRWRPYLESAIARGVSVCAILNEPHNWRHRYEHATPKDEISRLRLLEAAVDQLQSIGVHVTLRPTMHEKLIVIDDCILWEGSLNFLSWFNTSERVRRWHDRVEVRNAIARHNLLPCIHCPKPSPLGHELSKKRLKLGFKQTDIAEAVATHRRTILEIESGRRDPRLEMINRICEVLDLDHFVVPKHLGPAVRRLIERSCDCQ